jgi:hypothetical protein
MRKDYVIRGKVSRINKDENPMREGLVKVGIEQEGAGFVFQLLITERGVQNLGLTYGTTVEITVESTQNVVLS